jgi:hypothetical protein
VSANIDADEGDRWIESPRSECVSSSKSSN